MFSISKYSITLLVASLIVAGCSTMRPQVAVPAKSSSTAEQHVAPLPLMQPQTVKIALLLPLTGASKDLGRSMQDAAQLALVNSNVPLVELLPIDTEASQGGGSEAAKSAVAQGAKVIVGPIFSAATSTAIPVAHNAHIALVSFSNNTALKREGVYLIGFMPDQQIKRVARYALTQGKTDFYVLAPATTYGKTAVAALGDALQGSEGSIQKTEYYPEQGDEGAKLAIKSISDAIKNALNTQGKIESTALLIPEGGEKLNKIISNLALSGVDLSRVKLLGSGQWDDDSTKKNPLLQGGWFAGASPEQHKLFEQQFYDQFGYKPQRISSLAYDAVALLVALYSQQQDFSKTSLTHSQGFSGVDGIFRFRSDGLSERGLSVLQINNGDVQVQDPAPSAF